MSHETMSKEQLLQELADAHEQVIAAALAAGQRGFAGNDGFGPREIVAHLAGWETMAQYRVPRVAAGMAPLEFEDDEQNEVMNEAINAAFVALIGDKSLEAVCEILRRAYQGDIEMLNTLDDSVFRPGEYVYERTKSAIEHCQEHMEALGGGQG